MSADTLARAKAKLAANRAEGTDAPKKRILTAPEIAAIMSENRARGGSDVGETPPTKSAPGLLGAAMNALKERQTTDSNN